MENMYVDNRYSKGFGVTGVITFLVLVVVVGGVGYYSWSHSKVELDSSLVTDMASSTSSLDEAQLDIDNFKDAPAIDLKSVGGSLASGQAFMYTDQDVTYHKLLLNNLEPLAPGFFYEGWLVKDASKGDFVSTGKVNVDLEKNTGSLFYQINGDKTAYRTVVLTLEADDDNPAPDKHILEGSFDNETVFTKPL